ncbi:ABC transporter ATP-binding protein [Anatilimnocola aggregata]|nr:ABC transporter ATP-binding protein [Anatilimnocola aggregata]
METPQRTLSELALLARRATQVWPFVAIEDRLTLGSAALIMGVTSAANTGVAILLGQLVDRIQAGATSKLNHHDMYWAAGWILGGLAAIYLFREGLNVVRRSFVEKSVARLNRDMQLKLVGHALRGDLVSLSGEKVGALHGKIFRSVDGLIRFVRLMFLDCLPAFLTGFFALLVAFTKQPALGLIMLGVIPLAVFLTMRQLKSQKGVRLSLMRDCEEIDGAVVEQLNGAEYIRVAHTYNQEMLRLFNRAEKRRTSEVRHHFEMSLYGCAKALNEGFFHIVVLGLATYLAINGQISFGDVLTFSVLYLNVMAPLNEVHRVLDEGHEASLRVGDLLQMLHTPMDRAFDTPDTNGLKLQGGEPAIQVENLVVHYNTPDHRMRRALDHLSLTIRHGETIGIAGRSGSGKSTWIKVLLRLLHPDEGSILLGGKPLCDVSRIEMAQLISYVGQNPFVFSGSIHDNIAYGNSEVTLAQVQRAAELANLHDEIMQMPGGYQAEVTERGQNLSGGQRQRLAIARLLLKNSPILILDEATSALDNISERVVQNALGIKNTERTTIIIAHRLTTLKNCDRIFVFEDGRISAIGSYVELVAQNGLFAELVRSADAAPLTNGAAPRPLATAG